jgi:threonine dehydratase
MHSSRADFERAELLIRQRFEPSRLVRSAALSDRLRSDVHLKLECELPTGSFKVRGAYYALSRRREAADVSEVVAASTGNHGAAVAWAARELGLVAKIFVPNGANATKTARIRSLGAHLTESGADIEGARRAAEAYAANSDAFLLDDATSDDVPIGAGTIGVELLEQLPDMGAVIVPVGDSALIRGVAAAVKAVRPDVHVTGVQASGAPAYYRSWQAGTVVTTETADTIADGLATTRPTDANVIAVRKLVDEMMLVDEQDMLDAMRWLQANEGIVAEPAGAAAVAVLLNARAWPFRSTVALITGGNVAPAVANALASGESAPRR